MRAFVLTVGFLLAAVSPAAASSARVWVTTPDGAEKMHDRGTVDFHPGGSSALTVSVDPSRPTSRWTASAPRSPTRPRASSPGSSKPSARPRCAACSPTTSFRSSASRWAPPTSSTVRTTPTTTCRPGDRLPPAPLLDRARPRADPAAAAPRARAQPEAQGDRHAVEPAGVDEDEPVAGRRPADRLAAHLRRLRALLRQVRARVRARGRADLRAHPAERAAEPQPERATRAWTCPSARRRS